MYVCMYVYVYVYVCGVGSTAERSLLRVELARAATSNVYRCRNQRGEVGCRRKLPS